MSHWTHVTGTITVCPMGRTQSEKRYILETVLDHLPLVTGSEDDMNVHTIQRAGYNCFYSCDEFGMQTNKLKDSYGNRDQRCGWLATQSEYILVVEGDLRDRLLSDTYKEFINWLCRLSKRISVLNVLVNINSDDDGNRIIYADGYHNPYAEMFEEPSWVNDSNEPNWCEYLLWDRAKDSDMPMRLMFKYIKDKENDEEVKRRMNYEKECHDERV